MGRKYKFSKGKKHRTCIIVRVVKGNGRRIDTVNLENFHFEIKEEVIEALNGYAQHDGEELCGVLTGIKVDQTTYRICKVSPPCVKSHSRCGCERDAEKANHFITEDYEASEQTRTYIGEWHTHPENAPSPSSVDFHSIENNFYTASHTAPFLIMIILGLEKYHVSVYNGKRFWIIEPEVV